MKSLIEEHARLDFSDFLSTLIKIFHVKNKKVHPVHLLIYLVTSRVALLSHKSFYAFTAMQITDFDRIEVRTVYSELLFILSESSSYDLNRQSEGILVLREATVLYAQKCFENPFSSPFYLLMQSLVCLCPLQPLGEQQRRIVEELLFG